MFMIEKEESLKTPELLLKFLNEHDVKYKDRQLTKNSKIRVIVVKNKELEKIARAKGQGVSYGKGQHKFYYINDDVIMLYNYYGWQGNMEDDSTTNFITLIKGDKEKYKTLLNKDEDNITINGIETELKKVIGEFKEKYKYSDIFDFIEKNPKLLTKYIKELFEDKILFINPKFLEMLGVIEVIKNIEVNRDDVINQNEFSNRLEIFKKKINSKLQKKEYIMTLKDVQFLIKELKIENHIISYGIKRKDDEIGPKMFWSLKENSDLKIIAKKINASIKEI